MHVSQSDGWRVAVSAEHELRHYVPPLDRFAPPGGEVGTGGEGEGSGGGGGGGRRASGTSSTSSSSGQSLRCRAAAFVLLSIANSSFHHDRRYGLSR